MFIQLFLSILRHTLDNPFWILEVFWGLFESRAGQLPGLAIGMVQDFRAEFGHQTMAQRPRHEMHIPIHTGSTNMLLASQFIGDGLERIRIVGQDNFCADLFAKFTDSLRMRTLASASSSSMRIGRP